MGFGMAVLGLSLLSIYILQCGRVIRVIPIQKQLRLVMSTRTQNVLALKDRCLLGKNYF